MRRRLPHTIVTALAVAGFGLVGASLQGVADMENELRSSVRPVPVSQPAQPHDCPFEDRVVRAPEV
jgi:hypothetical protein